jgi:transcriptional regulator with XRE-family HTH domain
MGDMQEGETEERNARRPNPIDVHVGGRVRLRRMILGISQEKLGEQLGLTFQQVQKYEKGVNRIGASRLFDIANVLSVPVQFFYDDAPPEASRFTPLNGFGERPTEAYLPDYLNTREGVELNKAYARITDIRTRRAVLELVRALAPADAEGPGGQNPGTTPQAG